jgi:TonB family protein
MQQPDPMPVDTGVVLEAACDTAPRILRGPRLGYPLELLQNGTQGIVVVQFVLDTAGHAERSSIRVIATPHLGLNLSAKAYVQGAQFSPGIFHGRKVRTLVQFPVVYRIASRR